MLRIISHLEKYFVYRAGHQLADLVSLIWTLLLSAWFCSERKYLGRNSWGTFQIWVNPTQVCEQMPHPEVYYFLFLTLRILLGRRLHRWAELLHPRGGVRVCGGRRVPEDEREGAGHQHERRKILLRRCEVGHALADMSVRLAMATDSVASSRTTLCINRWLESTGVETWVESTHRNWVNWLTIANLTCRHRMKDRGDEEDRKNGEKEPRSQIPEKCYKVKLTQLAF